MHQVVLIALDPKLWIFFYGWIRAGTALAGTMFAPADQPAACVDWPGAYRHVAMLAVIDCPGVCAAAHRPLGTRTCIGRHSARVEGLEVLVVDTLPWDENATCRPARRAVSGGRPRCRISVFAAFLGE